MKNKLLLIIACCLATETSFPRFSAANRAFSSTSTSSTSTTGTFVTKLQEQGKQILDTLRATESCNQRESWFTNFCNSIKIQPWFRSVFSTPVPVTTHLGKIAVCGKCAGTLWGGYTFYTAKNAPDRLHGAGIGVASLVPFTWPIKTMAITFCLPKTNILNRSR